MFRYLKNKLLNLLTTKPRTSKTVLTVLVAFVLLGINIFVFAKPADAGFFGDLVGLALDPLVNFFASMMLFGASILGHVLVVMIDILLEIVKYNDFTNSRAVEIGWVVIRDMCNMFFIVILLIIAFGTIFRIENYKYNRLLPKLILMAVLINFSKFIAGFLIDVSQVMMMTFVNAFADAAATNFTSAFKLRQMLGFLDSGGVGDGPSNWQLLGAPALAIALLIVALMVMLSMVSLFLVRIIMLWILVALSPLAFLLEVFPGGAKYADQWWSKFTQWVTTGPILAFFLWLSLAVLSTRDIELGVPDTQIVEQSGGGSVVSAGLSAVSTSKNMLGFMFSVSMMMIALSVASSVGGTAGSAASKITMKIRGMGSAPFRTSSLIGRGRKALTGYVGEEIGSRLGILTVRDKWKQGWQRHRESTREERLAQARSKASSRKGVAGSLASPEHFFNQYWGAGGIKRAWQEGIAGGRAKKAEKKMKDTKDDLDKAKGETKKLEVVANGPTMEGYDKHIANKKELSKKMKTAQTDVTAIEIKDDKEIGVDGIWKLAEKKMEFLKAVVDGHNREIKKKNEQIKEYGGVKDGDPELIKPIQEEILAETKELKEAITERAGLKDTLETGKIDKIINLQPGWEFTKEARDKLDEQIGEMEKYYADGRLAKDTDTRDQMRRDLVDLQDREKELGKEYLTAREASDRIRPAINYDMLREQSLAIAKEKSDMLTDSWQELWAIYQDAKRRGDVNRAAAALLKTTEYANDNEFFNMTGDGSDAEGMRSFIMNEFVGIKGLGGRKAADAWEKREKEERKGNVKITDEGMGISETQALNIANLVAYSSEKIGHWMVARSVGVKDGKQFWQAEDDRLIEQLAEIRKIDPETFQRRVNRLGWGNELPRGIGKDESREARARNFRLTGERDFVNSAFALTFFQDNWKRWEELLRRGRFNESVALSITSGKNYEELIDLSGHQPEMDATPSGMTLDQMVDAIREFGASRGGGDPFDDIKDMTWKKELGKGTLGKKEDYEGKRSPEAQVKYERTVPM